MYKCVTYLLTLSDDLTGIKLRDYALEHLVDNGWQDTLVIVSSQFTVDCWQCRDVGSRKHTARNVDHLQICKTNHSCHDCN